MRKLLIIPFLSLLFSCSSPEKQVTKEEALNLSHTLDSFIRKKNGSAVDNLFSGALLGRRLKSKNILVDAAREKGINSGLRKAAIGSQIINAITTNDDSYILIKHYEKNGVQHLIYRLRATDGLNYHDFELDRYHGKVYIADVFVYTTGENLSKTISDFLEETEDAGTDTKKSAQALLKVKQAYVQGRYDEAKSYFEKLDPSLKNQRGVQFMYVMICAKLDEELYGKALDKFVASYPDDANTSLMMIDVCLFKKDYKKARNYVEKLDSVINRDPYLDYYRGIIDKLDGDTTSAIKYFENIYASMPQFSEGVLQLIVSYLEVKRMDEAKQLVGYYKKQKKFNQENLRYVTMMYPDLDEDK